MSRRSGFTYGEPGKKLLPRQRPEVDLSADPESEAVELLPVVAGSPTRDLVPQVDEPKAPATVALREGHAARQ